MKARALICLVLAVVAGALVSQAALAGGGSIASGPEAATAAEPALGPAPAVAGHLVARVRPGRSVALRSRPRGAVVARLGATTEFGRPRALGVVRVRGRWLGVTSAALPNGKLGWVKRSPGLRLRRLRLALHADISERTLELRRDGRRVRRFSVAVGRPGSPTPRGRFAVTDKLRGTDFGPYYGCCILALSATQPNPPPGWKGGNRMAIHGTNAPGRIGEAASAGCLRAGDTDLEALMRLVPAGTPVFLRG